MKHLPVIMAAGMALVATPATAQTLNETDAGEGLQDIIVTAQKRSQNLNDVGLSIQAFSGDDLKAAGIASASDLSQVVSGFNFSRSNANTPIFTLRGVGFQTPNLSSTSPVGIYVDEVAYAYPYMANGPTFDLQRVEVLKGPQGTLYGRNTTGGLVNFITAKPTDVFETGMSTEIGNYETFNLEGFVNIPLGETLAVRVAARNESSDKGWQVSRTRGDRLGKKDRSAARMTLLWEPSSDWTIHLGASWWRDQSDTVAPQASALDLARPATVIPGLAETVHADWTNGTADWDPREEGKAPFKTDSRFYALSGRIDHDLNDTMSIVSLTAYNHVRRRDFNDLDGTPFELLAYGSNGSIGSFSQELRLSGDNGPLNWMVGGFYARDKISDDQFGYYDDNSTVRLLRRVGAGVVQSDYTQAQIAGGFRNFRNVTDQTNRSMSLLANAEWKFGAGWTLLGGLRYTRDRIRFAGCSADYEGNTRPIWNTAVARLTGSNTQVGVNECLTYTADFSDNILARKTLKEENLAWRAGVNYEPRADMLLYASISRGFKSGAFPVLPANVETQFEPAVQEKVTAYEAGVKAGLFDRVVQANVSAFYYDYRNKQLFGDVKDPVFTTLSRIVNVPKSEVYGAEAELTVKVSQALRLQGSAAYVHSEITRFLGINRLGQQEDFAGNRFPNTPQWQLNGQAVVDQPIDDRLGVRGVISASYQSTAEGAVGAGADFRIKPYTVVNANLAVYTLDDRLSVGLFARNLFNRYYWSTVDTVIDTIFRVPGAPRTWGGTLSIKLK